MLALSALGAAACSDSAEENRDPVEGSGETTEETAQTGGADEEAIAEDDAIAAAQAFVDDTLDLADATRASLELQGVRRSPGAAHVSFQQVFDGFPVRGARLIVHVLDDGSVLGASDSLTALVPDDGIEQQLDEAEATDVANKAIPEPVEQTTSARVVWLPDGDTLRLGWSVAMATANNSYVAWVDAVSGEVADARQTRLDEASSFTAKRQDAGDCGLDAIDGPAACIFLPDPISESGGDAVDPDDADALREPVELLGLDDPESGALVGEFVDLESPNDSEQPVREEDGQWTQGRDDAGFEAAMAYVWIDRSQRLIQDLGFDDVRNESFPVVPIEQTEVDNAFFLNTLDTIFLGVGSSGIDAGEDAQVIVHEYGHAVLHDQVPDLLFNEAAGAYHEGFGDAFAFLVTLGEGTGDPACLFPWFLGEFGPDGCGRRMDEEKVFPDDLVNEVHFDGEIWTGAVFDIVEGLLDEQGLTIEDCAGSDACDDVRDRVLATILGSHEFLTGAEDLPEIAQAYVSANQAGFDGADEELILEAFADHGLDGSGDGALDDAGQPTGDVLPVAAQVDITHSFRGDLRVTIGVVDADFQDLCTPIEVLTPNAQDSGDNVSGTVDLSDTDCAPLVPPSADQQWVLLVQDEAAQDVGQINGFTVVVDGRPFLATGVPAPIADDDPTGTAVIVNASGDVVDQEGTEAPGDNSGGVPIASIDITHTFVGDLLVRIGVVDANRDVLCTIPVLRPDPTDDSDGASGDVDVSECAQFLPPSTDAIWVLQAVDQVALDEGTIDRFELFDASGTSLGAAAQVPVAIPDDDPTGAVAVIRG